MMKYTLREKSVILYLSIGILISLIEFSKYITNVQYYDHLAPIFDLAAIAAVVIFLAKPALKYVAWVLAALPSLWQLVNPFVVPTNELYRMGTLVSMFQAIHLGDSFSAVLMITSSLASIVIVCMAISYFLNHKRGATDWVFTILLSIVVIIEWFEIPRMFITSDGSVVPLFSLIPIALYFGGLYLWESEGKNTKLLV